MNIRPLLSLFVGLAVAACEPPVDDDAGCETTGCDASQVCTHLGFDVPGECEPLPAGCTLDTLCECDLTPLCNGEEPSECSFGNDEVIC